MKVSIIVPFRKETPYLKECIDHCMKLDYDDFELILLPDEKMTMKIKSGIKIIPTGSLGPAKKRDVGASQASGEILAFIDDDAYPKKEWLKKVVRNFKGDIVCVGGPAVTPDSDNLKQKASGLVFSSKVGGGTATYRYIPGKKMFVDDFPSVNMSVKKDVFMELGGFDNNYWPGEDTKFCLELVKKGYKIIYDPEAVVFHHRRELFSPHLKQINNYALHRGYFAKKFPETSFKVSYFIPSAFVLFIVLGLMAGIYYSQFAPYYLMVMSVYIGALVITAAKQKDFKLFLLLLSGIIVTHISYGLYFIKGLLTRRMYK